MHAHALSRVASHAVALPLLSGLALGAVRPLWVLLTSQIFRRGQRAL